MVALSGLVGPGSGSSSAIFSAGFIQLEGLSGAAVELGGDLVQFGLGVDGEVGAFGQVLAQQPVGVLVAAALPRAVRIAEIDLHAGLDR